MSEEELDVLGGARCPRELDVLGELDILGGARYPRKRYIGCSITTECGTIDPAFCDLRWWKSIFINFRSSLACRCHP